MDCTVYVASAFCHGLVGGNPAGVVFVEDEASFTDEKMQKIAKDLNFSETVFISKIGKGAFKARYFTPTSPIEFCGHASIAAFGVLRSLGRLEGTIFELNTEVGKCEVSLRDNLIFLGQPLPIFGEQIDRNEIISILGDCLSESVNPSIVSTGLRDIFVCVRDKSCLNSVRPNLELLADLNRRTNSAGMHVFSLNPAGSAVTAECRNFAPLFGIDEESATGSSSGALGCYLVENGLIPVGSEQSLLFRQGEVLGAPSDIYVQIKGVKGAIEKVECGGEVVIREH